MVVKAVVIVALTALVMIHSAWLLIKIGNSLNCDTTECDQQWLPMLWWVLHVIISVVIVAVLQKDTEYNSHKHADVNVSEV